MGALPGGLAAEALGMLGAALADFRGWGCVHTVTALDARFERIVPGLERMLPADEIVGTGPGRHESAYRSLLRRCDAVLVVAPETDGILPRLLEQAESAGIPVLGSTAAAAAAAGDKAECCRILEQAGLPVPRTREAHFSEAAEAAARMGFPLVLKPVDGAGSEGVCVLSRVSELPGTLAALRRSTARDAVLMQSLARGIPASVSLLASDRDCLPLSLNLQIMDEGNRFRYAGSRVPFDHPARPLAMRAARAAVLAIPGLRGYVGVDLVLGEDAVRCIEINPRLTTSYIALRRVAKLNLAHSIWDACMAGKLPDSFPLSGEAVIRKDDPNSWDWDPRAGRHESP